MSATLVKSADLSAMDRTIRAAFLGAYANNDAYKPRWPLFATRQESTSRENFYPSIIDAAAIREWTEGERVVNGIVITGARVRNGKYELTYGLRREDLDDDLTGTVRQGVSRVKSGAGKYLRHPDKLVFGVIRNNGTALDGLLLFHAAHLTNPSDAGSDVIANTDAGALTANNAASVRGKMMEIKTPDGDPANEDPRILMVAPAQELTARKIAQADEIVFSGNANETNVYKGMYTVVVIPQLSTAHGGNDGYWYMIDATDPEDRALIFQEREAVEMVTRFNLTDPNVFDLDQYVWGTRWRGVAAGGNPKKMFRRTG